MTVDAALSGLFAGSFLAALACAHRRPGFVPVAGALAVLGALHAARLVATPILDAAPVPYTGRALWAMRAEVVALAGWPWVTAALCVAVVRRKDEGLGTEAPSPRGVVARGRNLTRAAPSSRQGLDGRSRLYPPQSGPSYLGASWYRLRAYFRFPVWPELPEPAQPTALAARWQVPALVGGALLASMALAASYPALRGAALLAWYPRSRVAALAVVAGALWRRVTFSASTMRNDRAGLRGPEIPALVLAAEQLAQLVLWQAGPWRLAEAWPAVEVVSLAGYGALLAVLVGMAYRLRARS